MKTNDVFHAIQDEERNPVMRRRNSGTAFEKNSGFKYVFSVPNGIDRKRLRGEPRF
jgi:hypothetical protein